MERIEVELFTDGGNNAVIRMPDRAFPGVVVQGDSLSIIRDEVAKIRDAIRDGDLAEAQDLAEFLVEDLDSTLLRYTETLARHGIRRPY